LLAPAQSVIGNRWQIADQLCGIGNLKTIEAGLQQQPSKLRASRVGYNPLST
jgi:hypothetical protein